MKSQLVVFILQNENHDTGGGYARVIDDSIALTLILVAGYGYIFQSDVHRGRFPCVVQNDLWRVYSFLQDCLQSFRTVTAIYIQWT